MKKIDFESLLVNKSINFYFDDIKENDEDLYDILYQDEEFNKELAKKNLDLARKRKKDLMINLGNKLQKVSEIYESYIKSLVIEYTNEFNEIIQQQKIKK